MINEKPDGLAFFAVCILLLSRLFAYFLLFIDKLDYGTYNINTKYFVKQS